MDGNRVEVEVVAALRSSGARFAFAFGSQVEGNIHCGSDFDVAAWWPHDAPERWDLSLPRGVDLTVLNTAPLWLAGRIALHGRLIFDDDPPARVAWQADTRFVYLDEIPQLRKRQQEWLEAVSDG